MTRAPIRPESRTSSGNCVHMDWPVAIVCSIRNRQPVRMSSTPCVVSECRNKSCSIDWQAQTRPQVSKLTTIGQWYWSGAVEVAGEFPDLSKRVMFEPYLGLPARVPETQFELAMNISSDDPERSRLQRLGWHVVDPHRVACTPRVYRRYMGSALAEFTAIKGVDVAWRTGWLSDRAAAFLALGRPVITEDTGATRYLPRDSGFRFIRN